MANQIEDFKDDLVKELKEVHELSRRVFYVFDAIEMLELRKEGVKTPFAGVMWDGRIAVDKKGLLTTYSYKVFIAETHRRTTGSDRKEDTTSILNKVAAKLIINKTPQCRMWEFSGDGPVALHDNLVVYDQTWRTTASLTGNLT